MLEFFSHWRCLDVLWRDAFAEIAKTRGEGSSKRHDDVDAVERCVASTDHYCILPP